VVYTERLTWRYKLVREVFEKFFSCDVRNGSEEDHRSCETRMFEEDPFVGWKFGNCVREEDVIPVFFAQTLRPPVRTPPPPEEASPRLVRRHLLLCRVELRRGQLFCSRFVGNNPFLHLLVVPTDSEDLPRPHHPIIQSVDHVEDVTRSERHFSFGGIVVMEVGLDVEAVTLLGGHYAVVFFLAILHYQFYAVLEAQKEENCFFAGHSRHVHVVHFQDLVPGLESLQGRRTAGLDRCDKDADEVATS
jgi:hypothetical protein